MSTGVIAQIRPVKPPIVNTKMKPTAKSIGVSKRSVPSSLQPCHRCRTWNDTPLWRNRLSQARNSLIVGAELLRDGSFLTAREQAQAAQRAIRRAFGRVPETHVEALDAVVAACRRHGKSPGILLYDPSVFEASRTAQLSKLAEQCSIPKLEGTTDIYSFGQACLIAKRIAWSPRPVFQSYSAYTPKLAEINRQHLLGPTAPEHILFKVEPIDGRLPALEDGYSWPVLLNKYVLNGFQNEYLLLDKRTSSDPAQLPEFTALNSVSAEMGHPIEVPQQARTLIFASISVRPSMLGKLASVLFKPPQLNVRIGLANGSFKDYRYVARMAEKPILISPLVDTTRDFYLLANGNPAFIEGNRVVSIEIFAKNGASSAWNDAIEIQYFGLPSPPKSDAAAAAFDQPVTPWSGSAFNATAWVVTTFKNVSVPASY